MQHSLWPPDAGPTLTGVARAAIAERLGMAVEHPESATAPWLHEHGAAFVTLTEQHRLRGCIGSLEPWRPLIDDVRANAVSAAFHDPRFPQLEGGEFRDVSIEVSVLTPAEPFPVRDEADAVARLRPGVDGVVLESGRHRGTFLPQVWDQLPDPEQFLDHLKLKAGLPSDHWGPDVRLSRYQVTAFHEEDTRRST